MSDKKRALVVDDTALMRTGAASLISAYGFEFDLAEDGLKAYQMLSANPNYDIIFSDVEMPNMTGFELLARVKNNPTLSKIPFVLCTTLSKPEHIEKGRSLGATSYIVKPMQKETLERALRNAGMLS